MPSVVDAIRDKTASLTEAMERELDADVVGIFGPIVSGVEHRLRIAIESLPAKRTKLAVVLQTGGGSIEVTERMVNVCRHHYADVTFIVPDVALSAGTVLAMSGDAIYMDYFSCLGPIDPQVERDGKLVPALSYLEQFDRLAEKSRTPEGLSTADVALLNKLDLAELHSFEQAKKLSEDLLVDWLAKYKFKNWAVTETRKLPVTQAMKEQRAREIAEALNNHQRWRSHGRGIRRETLTKELNILIDDLSTKPNLAKAAAEYFDFVVNCMRKEGIQTFVISRSFI